MATTRRNSLFKLLTRGSLEENQDAIITNMVDYYIDLYNELCKWRPRLEGAVLDKIIKCNIKFPLSRLT